MTPSVLCFGELLIDMIATSPGKLSEAGGFVKKFGGAPANTAIGLAKLGIPTGFMGKVGDDAFGAFLQKTLEQYHVDTSSLITSRKYPTTLAFVSLTKDGQRDFSFYRGAHEYISAEEVSLPSDLFLFHFGSLLQTTQKNQQATEKLITQAKAQSTIISYDPNLRPSLWPDLTVAKTIISNTAQQVDILKINEDEMSFLSGTTDVNDAAQTLFTPNLDALLITLGGKGCYYKTKTGEGMIPTIRIAPLDTTGAGDAFNAGYIAFLYEEKMRFSQIPPKNIERGLTKANIIASLTTTKKGAITAFPTNAAITKAMRSI